MPDVSLTRIPWNVNNAGFEKSGLTLRQNFDANVIAMMRMWWKRKECRREVEEVPLNTGRSQARPGHPKVGPPGIHTCLPQPSTASCLAAPIITDCKTNPLGHTDFQPLNEFGTAAQEDKYGIVFNIWPPPSKDTIWSNPSLRVVSVFLSVFQKVARVKNKEDPLSSYLLDNFLYRESFVGVFGKGLELLWPIHQVTGQCLRVSAVSQKRLGRIPEGR